MRDHLGLVIFISVRHEYAFVDSKRARVPRHRYPSTLRKSLPMLMQLFLWGSRDRLDNRSHALRQDKVELSRTADKVVLGCCGNSMSYSWKTAVQLSLALHSQEEEGLFVLLCCVP